MAFENENELLKQFSNFEGYNSREYLEIVIAQYLKITEFKISLLFDFNRQPFRGANETIKSKNSQTNKSQKGRKTRIINSKFLLYKFIYNFIDIRKGYLFFQELE